MRSNVGPSTDGRDKDKHEDGLDEFDLRLVELKASGMTDADTADQLGCSAKTVQRHRKRPEIGAALAARKADRIAQLTALLGEAGVDAVRVLRDGLDASKDADRTRAATAILNALLRLRVGPELDQEVEQLRQEIAELRQTLNKENEQ
jgi:hypothetical protein